VIVGLVVACEVGFWVLLAAGLAVRYLLKWRRTSVVLLLCEPLLEVVLFEATAIDLKNGTKPSWEHGLAALYIGFTIAYGHHTIRWLDGHAAHRLTGAPPPPKPPRYGLARAAHEGRLWLRMLLATAVARALLQGAIWYVGSPVSLRDWQYAALRALGIHGLIGVTYLLWPKTDPAKEGRTVTRRWSGACQNRGTPGPWTIAHRHPRRRRRTSCSRAGRCRPSPRKLTRLVRPRPTCSRTSSDTLTRRSDPALPDTAAPRPTPRRTLSGGKRGREGL
jgi:hypothetical protein